MRNLIGFIKPQEPMGLQMVEGPRAQNQPRFCGGERGLGRAPDSAFPRTVSNLISQPSGTAATGRRHGAGWAPGGAVR